MVEDSSTTTLGPILPNLAGMVCTSRALGSHLAIPKKEFSIPIGTKVQTKEDLNRGRVRIGPADYHDGFLLLPDED